MSSRATVIMSLKQGAKHYTGFPIKTALVVLNKLSNRSYKKLYPRYLRWLGVNVSPDFASYGVPWINPASVFGAASDHLITTGDGTTISSGTVLVRDFSIDRPLYEFGGGYSKLISPISVGRSCFIGARSLVLPGTTIGNNCVVGGRRRQRRLSGRFRRLRQPGEGRGQSR